MFYKRDFIIIEIKGSFYNSDILCYAVFCENKFLSRESF